MLRPAPRATSGWGRWPPWGGHERRMSGQGHAPMLAYPWRSWRVAGQACHPPVCGLSAMVRGVPGQPGRRWGGPTTCLWRRGPAPGRRRRPWQPGAARGWRAARGARWSACCVPLPVVTRGSRPRGMRLNGPVVRRAATRAGRNGLWSCAPPCTPTQAAGVDQRLRPAAPALAALTPPRGRGKRQSTAEATRVEAMALVLKTHRVEGLLSVVWEKPVEQHPRYLGRGRGSATRPPRVLADTRSHIPRMARQADNLAGPRPRCGWQAVVTQARQQRLSWEEAVVG